MCQKQYTLLHQQSANTTFKLINVKYCFQQTAEFHYLPAMSSLKFSMHSVFNWKSLHHEHHVNIALDLCPLSPDYFPENVLPWNTKSFTVIVKGRLWLIGLAENCAENAIWAKKVTFLTKNEIILCQITKLDSFIILVLDFLNIFMLLLFFSHKLGFYFVL